MKSFFLLLFFLICVSGSVFADSISDPYAMYLGDVNITTAVGTGQRADPLTWNGTLGDWVVWGEDSSGNLGVTKKNGATNTSAALFTGIVGTMQVTGTVGTDFSLSGLLGNTGIGSPPLASGNLKVDDLSILSGGGLGTLYLAWTQYGMTTTFPGWNLSYSGTVQGGTGVATAYAYAYEDTGPFGFGPPTNQIGSTLICPNLSLGCAQSTSGLVSVPNPYSLTIGLTIVTNGSIAIKDNEQLTPVPEPPSLALVCLGLLSLIGLGRNKLKT